MIEYFPISFKTRCQKLWPVLMLIKTDVEGSRIFKKAHFAAISRYFSMRGAWRSCLHACTDSMSHFSTIATISFSDLYLPSVLVRASGVQNSSTLLPTLLSVGPHASASLQENPSWSIVSSNTTSSRSLNFCVEASTMPRSLTLSSPAESLSFILKSFTTTAAFLSSTMLSLSALGSTPLKGNLKPYWRG